MIEQTLERVEDEVLPRTGLSEDEKEALLERLEYVWRRRLNETKILEPPPPKAPVSAAPPRAAPDAQSATVAQGGLMSMAPFGAPSGSPPLDFFDMDSIPDLRVDQIKPVSSVSSPPAQEPPKKRARMNPTSGGSGAGGSGAGGSGAGGSGAGGSDAGATESEVKAEGSGLVFDNFDSSDDDEELDDDAKCVDQDPKTRNVLIAYHIKEDKVVQKKGKDHRFDLEIVNGMLTLGGKDYMLPRAKVRCHFS